LHYGPFKVLEKVDDNSYRLIQPPYVCICSVVNVENMKLYEPSMLDQETEERALPTMEYLAPESQVQLAKDIILQNESKNTI
jgi:hypothetical protein